MYYLYTHKIIPLQLHEPNRSTISQENITALYLREISGKSLWTAPRRQAASRDQFEVRFKNNRKQSHHFLSSTQFSFCSVPFSSLCRGTVRCPLLELQHMATLHFFPSLNCTPTLIISSYFNKPDFLFLNFLPLFIFQWNSKSVFYSGHFQNIQVTPSGRLLYCCLFRTTVYGNKQVQLLQSTNPFLKTVLCTRYRRSLM